MSSYVKKGSPLEYDNAPDWLVAYMRYRLTVLGNSRESVMTFFLTLREFFQWYSIYHDTGRQPQTIAELRSIDILGLPFSTVLDVKKKDIEIYLYFLADTANNAASTRSKKIVTIRGFYEYLIDQQESLGIQFDVNPADRIRSPKMPKKQPIYLPEQDQQALLGAVSGENEVRDYAIHLLSLVAGLRISEIISLDVDDISLDSMAVRVRQGKGNKARTVPLTLPCCQAIRDYLEEYRDLIQGLDTKALFVSKRFKDRLTARSLQKAMKKYTLAAKLGGKGYTPHKLRHTTATMLAKDDVDLQVIQRVLGHERPDTTEIYTHLNNADIARAVGKSSLKKLGEKETGIPEVATNGGE